MIIEKLKTLKNQSKITISELSNLSSIPEATIRRIFSGETPDPRFETVVKLVTAMGGSLDDFIGTTKKIEIEANAVSALKESYESRISDIKEHNSLLRADKRILAISTAVLMLFVVGLLIVDLSVRNFGWIQY